jgi:cyclopropane fatty-acyl-phospholipid synthase-like methyltransferase
LFHAAYDVAMKYDFEVYGKRHKELYAKALIDDDYSPVTMHYYSLQARVLQLTTGKYWHFIAEDPKLSEEENFDILNANFAEHLSLQPNETLCEIGCGLCRTGRDVARTMGAKFIGVTLSPHEVELGNQELVELGLLDSSVVIQGDYKSMPLDDGSCDALLAVYTLKYTTPGGKLNKAFEEVVRVLKPGGRFVSYEILTSEQYDEQNQTEAEWVYNISYHTGMPPLANVRHYRENAVAAGLKLVAEDDLQKREGVKRAENSYPFKFYHAEVYEPIIDVLEMLGVKRGLKQWFTDFIKHPTEDFISAMQHNILSCTTIFAYEKLLLTPETLNTAKNVAWSGDALRDEL